MQKAGLFDSVKVHYVGTLDDGTVFDSSLEREPLEFVVGEGMLLQAFEQGVLGMELGETKVIKIAAENAYGPYHKEYVADFNRSQFPPEVEPKIGYRIEIKDDNGDVIPAIITAINGDTVTLDANHPLAGRDITFKLQLISVSKGNSDGPSNLTF